MDLSSLISEIDRVLKTKELDPQKVYPLLQQVLSYLLSVSPSTTETSSATVKEEIVVETRQKIHKLTDLLDFSSQGWSLLIENSTNKFKLYLLEEATRKAYNLKTSGEHSLEYVLNDLNGLTSPELSFLELQKALGELKKVILCCSSWRHEAVCLQLEEILEIPDIFWLNPPVTLLISHLEKLEPLPTLVIQAGETITEFAIVNIPRQKNTLSSCFWRTGSIKYGQEAIVQDIFTNLIHPQWKPQLSATLPKLNFTPARVGQADSQTRSIFKTQLETHPLGSALLKSTVLIQNILQEEEYVSSELQGKKWEVKRSEYHSQIISPYLEYLQVSIEDILKISLQDIQQVVWGGTLLESIDFSNLPWSSQTFPQAKFFSGLSLAPGLTKVLNYPALFV